MSRGLAGVALATLTPFTLLALWARLVPVAPWELELLPALSLPDGPWGAFVRALNTLGELWIWIVLVFGLAAGALLLRHFQAAALIGLTLVADIAGFGVKLLVERRRPEGALIEHILGGESFAFPSGHVLRITALVAVVVWLAAPERYRLALAVLLATLAGSLMAYARVALGVHWPTDVLGGLLLGLAWFGITCRLLVRSPTGHPM